MVAFIFFDKEEHMENTNINNPVSEKLPFKVKLGYGMSGYVSFITWTAFSYYGLYFFTDVVGLSAAFAGAMISLGRHHRPDSRGHFRQSQMEERKEKTAYHWQCNSIRTDKHTAFHQLGT